MSVRPMLRRAWLSLRRSYFFWRYHRLQLRIGTANELFHSTVMEHIRDALREQIARDEQRLAALVNRIGKEPRA